MSSRFPSSSTPSPYDFPSTTSLPFSRIVVDVGANDGFLSSNSFNLAALGWSTVLVEPNPSQVRVCEAWSEATS